MDPPTLGGGATGMSAGTRKSPGDDAAGGGNGAPPGTGDTDSGRFSSKELEAANIVSPGADGGSSNGAGILCSAPKPRVQPSAPWPPQFLEGVISTGRVTLYSWL